MIQIPIAAVPNQTLSITLDTNNYDISLYTTNRSNGDITLTGVMGMTIVRNNVPVITGQRVVSGYPVIPYRYLENGNFIFTTLNDDYPDYTQFGITQFLIYASAAELAALRAVPTKAQQLHGQIMVTESGVVMVTESGVVMVTE